MTPAISTNNNGNSAATTKMTTPKLMRNNPYHQKGGTTAGLSSKTVVTPTPRNQRVHHDGNNNATMTPKMNIPNHDTQRSTKPTPQRQPQQRKKTKPPPKKNTNLKSQLKSQIATLHRQKRQFLQQQQAEKARLLKEKERERVRLLKEKETERLRLIKVEDTKRLARSKEVASRKKEEEKRRGSIGKCMNDLVKGVEQRMRLECRNDGVHYAICESMESIVGNLERREEKKRWRLMAKRATHAHAEIAMGVMNNWTMPNTSMLKPSMMHQYPAMSTHQQGQQHMQHPVMHPSMTYNHPSINGNYYAGQHHPALMQPMQYTHHPQHHGILSNSCQPPMPFANMHPSNMTHGMPSSIPLFGSQQARPVSQATIKPLAKKSTPATTLALHHSPITDLYSPYSKSHYTLPTEIFLTKKRVGDSFGVTLRKSQFQNPVSDNLSASARPARSSSGRGAKSHFQNPVSDNLSASARPARSSSGSTVAGIINY